MMTRGDPPLSYLTRILGCGFPGDHTSEILGLQRDPLRLTWSRRPSRQSDVGAHERRLTRAKSEGYAPPSHGGEPCAWPALALVHQTGPIQMSPAWGDYVIVFPEEYRT